MPRRIEIELTSARPDGTWTWRAAGAREPKGVLDGALLYEGAKAGDVLRAEAEFELEGIVITSVTAPKTESRSQAQTIEVVGPSRPETPGVTTQLVGRGDRGDRRDRRGDDDRRRDRGPGRPPERGRGDGGRPRRDGAPVGGGPDRGGRPPRGEGDDRRAGGRDPARRETGGRDGARPTGGPDGSRRDTAGRDGGRRDTGGREGGRRDGRDGAGSRPPRSDGDRRPAATRTSSQAEHGDRSKGRRLNPGSAHRKAVMESLPPEHQPIAEQLLRGGIPAVRTALHLEREKAEAEGRPAPNNEALLELAESLLPRLRAAEWRDRAEAAVAALDGISMRDLRSIVAGADVARDEESRKLATTLREAVDAKVAKLHSDWTADITAQLDAGRVVRAVRLSARPPDASARLDPEMTKRLTEAAGATLAPGTSPDLWMSLLDALTESPIRRAVQPAGLPEDAPPELKKSAHQHSGSIPALAKMLGVTIPPPPAPVAARKRPADRPAGPRPRRPAASGGGDQGAAPQAAAPDAGPPEVTSSDTPAPQAPATAPPASATAPEAATPEPAMAGEEQPASDAEQVATEAAVQEVESAPAASRPAAEVPGGDGEAPAATAEAGAGAGATEAAPTEGDGDGEVENPSPS